MVIAVYPGDRERQGRVKDTAVRGAELSSAGRRCVEPGVVERAAAFPLVPLQGGPRLYAKLSLRRFSSTPLSSVIIALDVCTYVLLAPSAYLSQA